MGMIAILADAWTGMARRRRQRLTLAELMRMAPRRRDELGIDFVDVFEARVGRDRATKAPSMSNPPGVTPAQAGAHP